ncbi:hypothetical protein R69658_04228 [Paraburkholderia aspalathi]|uniref:Uncharacterized protein n=1 Tax=Paraburkholderia aspalathi TaxID=1324617 RepID=A0ABN7M4J4_9BURK|nr:hypothetical protein [Paraburkholderia aspalathi]MBK3832530.1 hypothetical protein [Paraburkholderia aspalathi]MBK3862263.1 hypothetical protein [Paraburkholderia aspalathi]CAE6784463.1 hypothetical protein R69658_04228 [Paraburkholderia aspalathi]
MKEFILLIAAIAIWATVWRFAAKHWRRKGWNAVISHLSAAVSGLVLSFVFLCVFLPARKAQNEDVAATSAQTSGAPVQNNDSVSPPSAGDSVKNGKSEIGASGVTRGIAGNLPKEFTGLPSTDAEWPKVASASLPVSDDEKTFLADRTCLDESSCYGPGRFKRYILKMYPDIAHVKFVPDRSEEDDEDTLALRRQFFVQSLYFAKQIQLANGQSLFDFLRNCSKRVSWLNAAEETDDSKTRASYFDLRYFPVLRSRQTGREVEMNMVFDRRGNQLIATSPFFSSNALKEPDFLARHELECWPKQ